MSDNKIFQGLKEKSFAARLKRLFSTDVIIRSAGGKKLKVIDTDEIQYSSNRGSIRDRFNRFRSASPDYHNRDFSLAYQVNRTELFRDYDVMDSDPILNSALDVYADESTSYDEMADIIKIKTTNDEIFDALHNLFYDILNIEFNLWSWVRSFAKYGDFYLKLHISSEYGVYMVEPISPYYIERLENLDKSNKNYVKFKLTIPYGGEMQELENYQVAHFRMISDSNFLPYGKSMLEGARRTWKQLTLMEDAMLIHRIMRAPEKRKFKIDIGNIPPNEVDNYIESVINKMQKVPFIDPETGDYNLKFNMQNMIEDFYIPVRGSDSGTDIDNIGGLEWTSTDDIEYLKNRMMAGLKIPKAFLGYEEGVSGKATLAAEDIRFARTIQRMQRIIISELNKIALVHLFSLGFTDEQLVDFELSLTNPSTIFEKEKIEIWSSKIDLAAKMQEEKLFSREWIYENIFNMSDQEMIENQKGLVDDMKAKFRFTSIEEEGTDPALEFMKPEDEQGEDELGGDFGDELGGDLGGDLGSEPVGEKPAGNEPPELKEVEKTRDQTGRKNARDYPFGEDPLGTLELNSDVRLSPRDKFKKKTSFSVHEIIRDMSSLNDDKLILSENLNNSSSSISYMDEINIKE